jgi:hypothetical protein
MQTVLRLTNAALLPAAFMLALLGSRPLRADHTWTGVFTLLVLWLLRRTWKAVDDSRPYPMRTLKLCGWLLAFGALERVIESITV